METSQLPRRRTQTPGPELELTQAALERAHEIGIWHDEIPPVFFREPALPTGFPDVVGVLLSRKELLFSPERLKLKSEHLRLLHYIFSVKKSTPSAAAEALLWSQRSLASLIGDLEQADLVRCSKGYVRCAALAEIFVAKKIVAVEAKIDKWESAVRQAVANTWFASHSFILVPDRRWSEDMRNAATRFGIGVLTFDGSRTRVRLRAKKQHIPSSYGSWMVNEWTIRQEGRPLSRC